MRTDLKLVGVAAILATTVSGAAIAQQSETTKLPSSMETSDLVESTGKSTVENFDGATANPSSTDTTRQAESGEPMATPVDDTIAQGDVPTSLETSRLAEASDLTAANDPNYLYVWPMSQVDGATAWEDSEAAEMRQAIVANVMVKDALEAKGYSEDDVVAAYTRADGGLTIVVDG